MRAVWRAHEQMGGPVPRLSGLEFHCRSAAIGAALWYASSKPLTATSPGAPQAATGDKGGKGDPAARIVPVVAAPVRQGTLDIYLFALGTVTPLNAVVVRSRVDGQLMKLGFEEGQMVKKGDLLAQVDPRPFEVQLTLASGQQARNSQQQSINHCEVSP